MSELQFSPLLYEIINTDDSDFFLDGREHRRKYQACKKAFERFQELRGQVVSQAIAIEKELDRAIAWYFVPRLRHKRDQFQQEEDDRRNKLIDLVLGQESFMISSKVKAMASIIEGMEIQSIAPNAFRQKFEAIVEIRNQLAHRRVGIDWLTQKAALWDAKKRRWGFPVFDERGNKKEKKWNDRIPDKLDNFYSGLCKVANTDIDKLWRETLKLRVMDNAEY